MRAAQRGSLGIAWRCWLVLLVVGYAVLAVACAAQVAAAIWLGSGAARLAALLVMGVYALEARVLWRWAGQAAPMLPPTRLRGYLLVALVHTAAGAGLARMVLAR